MGIKNFLSGLRTPETRDATPVMRPCEVDGKPCLFHRWVDEERALLKVNAFVTPEERDRLVYWFREADVVSPGCSTEVVRCTLALVEHADGSVAKVKPELVTFLDRGC